MNTQWRARKIHFNLWATVAFISVLLAPNIAKSDSNQGKILERVTKAVISICRGGTLEGESAYYEVVAEGDVRTIVIKKLIEGGLDARLELTGEEWKGIKNLANDKDYPQCALRMYPIIFKSISTGNIPNIVLKDRNFGHQGKYYYSHEFRPRFESDFLVAYLNGFEISDRKAKISIELQSKFDGKILFLVHQRRNLTLTGNRGGYCADTYKKVKVIGIGAYPSCCGRATTLQPQDTISFIVTNLPCTENINGDRASIGIPYYAISKNDGRKEEIQTILFNNLALGALS